MPTLTSTLAVVAGSFVVGVLGGVFGVGGGVFLVPFLTIAVGLRPVEAVGVSLFCVIGTSASASSVTLRNGEANLGLSLSLEPLLIVGAVVASFLVQRVTDTQLLVSFGALLCAIAVLFLWQALRYRTTPILTPERPARILDGVSSGALYRPQRVPLLLAASSAAGAAAGLFGIGGGVVTVPMLSQIARVPMRASAATSTLSLMISAAAAGAVHLAHNTVPTATVGAALLGVLPGGQLGARLQQRVPERAMRAGFALIAVIVAVGLFWRVR